jgi:hypothetical protein
MITRGPTFVDFLGGASVDSRSAGELDDATQPV